MQAPGDLCLRIRFWTLWAVYKYHETTDQHLHLIQSSAAPFVLQRNVFISCMFHSLWSPLAWFYPFFLKVPPFLFSGTVAVALFYNLLIPMYSSWKLQWLSITHVCINYWNPFSPCKNGLKVLLGRCAERTLTAQIRGSGPMNMDVGGEREQR